MPALSISEPREFLGPNAEELKKKQEAYNSTDYHQPSDQFDPAWDFSGAVEDMQLPGAAGVAHRRANARCRATTRATSSRTRARSNRDLQSRWPTSKRRRNASARLRSSRLCRDRGRAARGSGGRALTPLIDVPLARRPVELRPLFLKCENLQPMGAFKIRGAYNMIAQLSREECRAA